MIADHFHMSRSAVSLHLRVLREARLVKPVAADASTSVASAPHRFGARTNGRHFTNAFGQGSCALGVTVAPLI